MHLLSYALFVSNFAFENVLAAGAKVERPLVPMEDPFYLPPADDAWKSSTGEVLDKREVDISRLFLDSKSAVKGYQLLYSTRDVHGNPDVSVTTVIVPIKPNRKRVISLQSAYDSPDINCAPSYGLRYKAKGWGREMNQLNLLFLAEYLGAGPIINIPDYEGSNAAFSVGPQSGYQTLDSIKAVMSLESKEYVNIEEDAKVTMLGYSGGALATEWATEMKSQYANSLPIIGAVIGGAPTNISQVYQNVNGKKLSGLNAWAMLGIMNAYPVMDQWMREDLRTDAHQGKRFLLERTSCSYEKPALAQNLSNRDISAMFKNGDSFLTKFKPILDDIGVMGQNLKLENDPGYPLVFFYGDQDEVTFPPEDTARLITKWKEEGTAQKVSVWVQEGADHTKAALPGMIRAYFWMQCNFDQVETGEDKHCDKLYPEKSLESVGNQFSFSPSEELR